jgi:hypothetical protein
MLNDPKWRVISQKSQTRVCEVVSVALAILNSASQNDERGVYTLEAEDISAALDIDEEKVLAILQHMEGRFISGGKVINWEKRQPKREDSATERTKAWRERKRTHGDAPVTQCDALVTHGDAPDTDTDTEKKDIPPTPKGESDSDFELVWAERWSRGNESQPKAPALKAYKAAIRAGITHGEILEAVKRRQGIPPDKVGTAYAPQMATWLNQRRWRDAAPQQAQSKRYEDMTPEEQAASKTAFLERVRQARLAAS